MSLKEKINQDFIKAMKSRDDVKVSVLRMLKTAMTNKEKELRRGLEDSDIVAALNSQAKQRRDSIEQFRAGGREDLAVQEEAELAILADYLPRQMTREEVEAAVGDLIAELHVESPKEIGRVMKAFMAKYAGKADGKTVQEAVKTKFSGT